MRTKPGRPRQLTVDQIIDAVLAEGLATFSMPQIARRLNVAHSGLYRYVDSREHLLVLAMDRIAREAPWPSTDLDWRDEITAIGETLWGLCQRYTGYDVAAVTARNISPGFVEKLTPHVESLCEHGLDLIDATAAIDFIRTLVLNSSIDAARMQSLTTDQDVPEHSIPGFTDPEKWSGRGWYQRHLDTHLDGLAQRLR
ncbi:MAG: TetR family transcriptional regulator [Aeromicrobium sp.]|jgi:AcrR family transcriptional regulator|uniref:TetR/AcrR family transcriptional regulator n=1 Tax=Aeromicrobium sp. TaxID=1871063 RepID=UPI00262B195E|nr:TetR/AcrR family transcriptional regulator [Aeromicrobium sp.]MCW2789391.1 TetR family transcriptional regulator [Aeromicrobium sp.]MCW2823764.1 TetR family transcriptional regulator [Aeromicrobium sp.]